jgi:iron complex transport system ATP-binding protein
MIEVSGLCVARGGRTVVDGCSFALARGRIMAILGANGVGKTTLLSALVGVLRPSAGRIRVDGRIGFVPQLYDVPFEYAVTDIVLMGRVKFFGLFGAPSAADYEAVRRALARLGVSDLAERSFNSLSGGQRQLAIIAQALASDCEILVLDEPCAALDYRNQSVVIGIMRTLSAELGITIVFSSHMPQHAVDVASDVLLMHDRAVYRHGATADVLSAESLSALYGIPVGRAQFADGSGHTFSPLFRVAAQAEAMLAEDRA